MNILIINAGSSSIKYQLIEMPVGIVKCVGLVERIGFEEAIFTHEKSGEKHRELISIPNHKAGMEKIADALRDVKLGVIQDVAEIEAVGHRVVHGGSRFTQTTLISEEIKESIQQLSELAPLHNPANLIGIEIAETVFSSAKQIAVFDTAFHQTLPQKAYQYAIPKKLLEEHQIRTYGFHGTSHKYVSEKALQYLQKPSSKIISIHLGNGCSMAAIKDGKCLDTSLGFGPMNGLVMGTRSGDIDPSVLFYLHHQLDMTMSEINHLLQKESGLNGLTGFSDVREIEAEAETGNQDCIHALELTAYRIQKYIGSYVAVLNGLDALVFTAGIGENSAKMRALVCKNLDFLGISIDDDKNQIRSKETREIQQEGNPVKVFVIPTNEEFEIAKQTYKILNN